MSALLLSALAGLCTWGQQHLMVTVSQEDDVCSAIVSTGRLMQLKTEPSHQRDVACLKGFESASAHACH